VGRFPEDVRVFLAAAGWRSGRDVSERVRGWLRDLYAEDPRVRSALPLFPAAQAALAEFGGLRFTQRKRVGSAYGGFRIELWPDVGRVPVELCEDMAGALGAPVFPLAWHEDGPSVLVVDAGGRVLMLHPVGEFLVGATVDEAIVALVRGAEPSELDDLGRPVRRP
jgi:hypothetical protein